MHSRSDPQTDSAVEISHQECSSTLQPSTEPMDFVTTGQLFDQIRDFFGTHPGLTTDSIRKLTYFVFALQFPECIDIWPFASVVAPDVVGSSLLLRMIACLCVAPIQIGGVTLDSILALPRSPRPTLLLMDQLATSKELESVLRIMSRPGALICRKGKLHDISIPTLVCTAEPLRDRWILEQAIHIVMTPTRGGLPKFDAGEVSDSARVLRGKLLQYRETNLAKIRTSQFDAPQLSSPMREIANMLGRCIDDDALQSVLPMLLAPQDRDIRTRLTDSVHAVEIEAALFLSHEIKRVQARVGEIADVASAIFKGRGESIQLDPREVGNHLRSLGLFSERLGRAGRGIHFTIENRRRIHDLAGAYDVRSLGGNADCELCRESRVAK